MKAKDPRQAILESETHAELQAKVIDLLHCHGFHVFGCRPGMTKQIYRNKKGEEYPIYKTPILADGEGFPDLFAMRIETPTLNDVCKVGIEIKTEKDKLRPAQKQWKEWFEDAGILYLVIRPSNFEDLERRLK